jgi:cardiolipin synthase A/B
VLVAHILGFLSSIDAVRSTRTPQGTIAWAVALNTFPYVAVPAFRVLGRSRFHG